MFMCFAQKLRSALTRCQAKWNIARAHKKYNFWTNYHTKISRSYRKKRWKTEIFSFLMNWFRYSMIIFNNLTWIKQCVICNFLLFFIKSTISWYRIVKKKSSAGYYSYYILQLLYTSYCHSTRRKKFFLIFFFKIELLTFSVIFF